MPMKSPVLTNRASNEDAVAMLTDDHRRVAKLFAEFANVKDSGNGDTKKKLVARICQELVIHTAIEEEIFYPAVRIAIDDEDQMDEALVEHAGAKDLIAQLQAAIPSEPLYDAKVTVLGEQIDHHVEEEEGSMFPQARASALDLVALAAHMRARKEALLADPSAPPVPPTLGAGDDGEENSSESADVEESEDVKSSPLKRRSTHAKTAPPSSKTRKTSKQSNKKR